MRFILATLACSFPAGQDEVRDLIEKLRSDRIEDRDDAIRKLEDKGKVAVPALEKLLQDPDAEMRQRARRMLDEISRRECIRAAREPGKRVTVEVRNASLTEAARKVFNPFETCARIRAEGSDIEILGVSLDLQDCGFWDAVDAFCETAQVRLSDGTFPFPLAPSCQDLTFGSPFSWPHRWETIGDVRIFACAVVMAGRRANHGEITARLSGAFAPWAVPDHASIQDVKIAGQPIEDDERFANSGAKREKLPRESGQLTVASLWWGKGAVSRRSLEGAKSLSIEGTLVLTRGIEVVRIPFKISDLPIPPAPDR